MSSKENGGKPLIVKIQSPGAPCTCRTYGPNVACAAHPIILQDDIYGRIDEKELFPRLTPEGIQSVLASLVTACTRQSSDDLTSGNAPKWDSQEGLLWFQVRNSLANANNAIALARAQAAQGKLRIR